VIIVAAATPPASHRGSQTDPRIPKEIIDGADNVQVIIDDGSHRSEHILQTFAI